MDRFIKRPDVPIGYTPTGDEKTDPLGSVLPFWNISKWAETLSGLRRLMGYEL